MPKPRVIDIEVPSIFIKRALTNPDPRWLAKWRQPQFDEVVQSSQQLVAEHGNRFWRDRNVPIGAINPYIYWSGETKPDLTVKFADRRRGGSVSKKVSQFTIRTVRRFPAGRATNNLSRPAYDNMVVCLSDLPYTPVYDSNDVLLAEISECVWVDDHDIAYTDEDTKETIVELGIVIRITYN